MSEATQIRLLIVDDHRIVRDGLKFCLSSAEDIAVIGEAGTGAHAIRLCEELHPDVVLMDLLMPDMDGAEATRTILARGIKTQVLILTSFEGADRVQGALQAGAIGYLLKDVTPDELADAVRAALAGRSTLSPQATQALVNFISHPVPTGLELTEREIDVLTHLVDGLSNREIAARLQISVNTVRHYVRNILAKLDASNRTEAVSIALQHNLVSPTNEPPGA